MRTFLFTLLTSLSLSANSYAQANCTDAVVADETMWVTGQSLLRIDCNLHREVIEFPVVYQVRAPGMPLTKKIAFKVTSTEQPEFSVTTPEDMWCSGAGGIVAVYVKLDCTTAGGEYGVSFASGNIFSPQTWLQVTPIDQ